MSGDVHVRFCESRGVRFPPATHLVVMVHGTRDDAEALWGEVAAVLAPIGLRLSEEKTKVCHIDEGFDFLGWRIQRRPQRDQAGKTAIYTYPSKKSMASIKDKVRTLTRRAKHRTLADLLRRLNPVLRGWCNYFRHGVCKRTFSYLDNFAFWRIVGWLKKRHLGLNMHSLVRRHLPGWKISDGGIEMFRPGAVAIERYRYRGIKIPTPWMSETTGPHAPAARARGEPDAVEAARPVRRAGRGNQLDESRAGRPGPTPTPTSQERERR